MPGDDFGCPGHFRLSYCVQTEQIERAMPLFEKLAKDKMKSFFSRKFGGKSTGISTF